MGDSVSAGQNGVANTTLAAAPRDVCNHYLDFFGVVASFFLI